MRTLVIHPEDHTTTFLKAIYCGLNYTIINSETSPEKLVHAISSHDRLIFLGHGTAYGLLGWGRLAFHKELLPALKNTPGNIFIWCNANEFVKRHSLKGFHTGMFISEPLEALMYGADVPWEEIRKSNNLFANLLYKALSANLPSDRICNQLQTQYASADCAVRRFNSERLYYADQSTLNIQE